jgi:hypothetical protein
MKMWESDEPENFQIHLLSEHRERCLLAARSWGLTTGDMFVLPVEPEHYAEPGEIERTLHTSLSIILQCRYFVSDASVAKDYTLGRIQVIKLGEPSLCIRSTIMKPR